jgi:hypothetical protein
MSDTKQVQFSFLTAGPSFSLAIPTEFDDAPELSSPLFNGVGGRSFDFAPSKRDPGVDPAENKFVRTITDKHGREVSLYERIADPPLWWLWWPLSSGSLYSHLREEDGLEMPDETVAGVDVIQRDGSGLPFLVPESPFRFGASVAPNYQERALFFATELGPTYGIQLQRPGFLAAGDTRSSPDSEISNIVSVRAGTDYDVEVRVWGEDLDTASNTLSGVLGSLSDLA